MKLCSLMIAAAFMVSCEVQPMAREETGNPSVKLERLFEHDGCTMYRFMDAGRYVYWAACAGTTRGEHVESCGKNCEKVVADMSVTTMK